MDIESLKLPGKKRKRKKDRGRAAALYERSGRIAPSGITPVALPVSLDPDAMQLVLEETVMAEHRKEMEKNASMALEQMKLPSPNPGPIMGG